MEPQELKTALNALLALTDHHKKIALHLLEEKTKLEISIKKLPLWMQENPLHFPVAIKTRMNRIHWETEQLDNMLTQIKIMKDVLHRAHIRNKARGMAAMINKEDS